MYATTTSGRPRLPCAHAPTVLTPAACCGSRASGAQQGRPSSGRGWPFGHGVVSCPKRFHCSSFLQPVIGSCDSQELKSGSFGCVGSVAWAAGSAPAASARTSKNATRRARTLMSRERVGCAETCALGARHRLELRRVRQMWRPWLRRAREDLGIRLEPRGVVECSGLHVDDLRLCVDRAEDRRAAGRAEVTARGRAVHFAGRLDRRQRVALDGERVLWNADDDGERRAGLALAVSAVAERLSDRLGAEVVG